MFLGGLVMGGLMLLTGAVSENGFLVVPGLAAGILGIVSLTGLFTVGSNQAKVLQLFGVYKGSASVPDVSLANQHRNPDDLWMWNGRDGPPLTERRIAALLPRTAFRLVGTSFGFGLNHLGSVHDIQAPKNRLSSKRVRHIPGSLKIRKSTRPDDPDSPCPLIPASNSTEDVAPLAFIRCRFE